jgi:hypothetical protein
VGHLEQLKCILLVIAFFVSVPSLAQKYFGISGGLVHNNLVGSEIDFRKKYYNNEVSPRNGPTFSLLLKNELSPYLYLKGEASYIRKSSYSSNNILWNLNLEYLSVPLKIGYQPLNFGRLDNIQLGIEAGASFNYVPGHGADELASAYGNASKSKVHRAAVSAVLGANLEYRLSHRRMVFLNGSWYHDLTPLLSYEIGNATYKATNQGWMLTVGLLQPLH